ncbi:MAG: CBS domain-containing protein [Nitrospiraceae bacterium]|nr:MAG: CBS domain-containing protein [Nitrospiraceae bacterium]
MLKIKDVLKRKGSTICSIGPNETVHKALEVMAEKDIGALMVIDEGKVAGIFSERDYARKVILKGKSSKETLIGELMTRDVYSIGSDKSIEECLALMTTAHIRHLPVYEDNHLAGIVTLGDIATMIIEQQKVTINVLENYITGIGYPGTAIT